MLSRNHDGRDRTHWLDERGQPACWNAHQECAEHKVAVLTAANTALSERLAAVTAGVEDALDCLPRAFDGSSPFSMSQRAEVMLAIESLRRALAAGQPAPAAAEGA